MKVYSPSSTSEDTLILTHTRVFRTLLMENFSHWIHPYLRTKGEFFLEGWKSYGKAGVWTPMGVKHKSHWGSLSSFLISVTLCIGLIHSDWLLLYGDQSPSILSFVQLSSLTLRHGHWGGHRGECKNYKIKNKRQSLCQQHGRGQEGWGALW